MSVPKVRTTQVRGLYTLMTLLIGTTSSYLFNQPPQLLPFKKSRKRIVLAWPFPHKHQHARWPIDVIELLLKTDLAATPIIWDVDDRGMLLIDWLMVPHTTFPCHADSWPVYVGGWWLCHNVSRGRSTTNDWDRGSRRTVDRRVPSEVLSYKGAHLPPNSYRTSIVCFVEGWNKHRDHNSPSIAESHLLVIRSIQSSVRLSLLPLRIAIYIVCSNMPHPFVHGGHVDQ